MFHIPNIVIEWKSLLLYIQVLTFLWFSSVPSGKCWCNASKQNMGASSISFSFRHSLLDSWKSSLHMVSCGWIQNKLHYIALGAVRPNMTWMISSTEMH